MSLYVYGDTQTHTKFLIFITDLLKFNFCKRFSSVDINKVLHQLTGYSPAHMEW